MHSRGRVGAIGCNHPPDPTITTTAMLAAYMLTSENEICDALAPCVHLQRARRLTEPVVKNCRKRQVQAAATQSPTVSCNSLLFAYFDGCTVSPSRGSEYVGRFCL